MPVTPETSPPLQRVRELPAGDKITGFYMLTKFETRPKRDGTPYAILHLQDASGKMEARKWEDFEELAASAKPGDVLKIELPTQKILARYEFKVGNKAYMTGGRHVGIVATIKDIEVVRRPSANVITFEEEFSTTSEHVFVVGTNVTDLDLPGVTL